MMPGSNLTVDMRNGAGVGVILTLAGKTIICVIRDDIWLTDDLELFAVFGCC
jgi:hypothetical protein